MPKIDIQQYHTYNKRKDYYKKAVDFYNDLRIHVKGEYPDKLIDERRPGESDTIKKYRKKIFISKTQSTVTKIFNSLQKIRKSRDYLIKFNAQDVPKIIATDETPENYLSYNFPKYESLDNWFWSVAFSQYLTDANSLVLTIPMNWKVKDNEYIKPYPLIYNSDQILDYEYDNFVVLKSKELSKYKSGNRTFDGSIYYYVDKLVLEKYTQVDAKGSFKVDTYNHNLGYLPVTRMNGVIYEDNTNDTLYISRIQSIVSSLNEAAREYSDLQAEIVQHIHSTMWAINGKECLICKGTGIIPKQDGGIYSCDECKGRGFFPFNPFEHISIKQQGPGETAPPTPPAGYLSKPIDIAELQNKRVHDHLYHALSSINMEFLASVPLSQSGVAKEIDRAELNNFVYSIAEDCIRILDSLCKTIIDYRYGGIISNKVDRDKLLPYIQVPEKYDIIPDNYLVEEIEKLRNSKVSPVIINAAEVEYASKKFNTNKKIKEKLEDIYQLDPLSGMANDEILTASSNGVISKKTYIIHSNIREFIDYLYEDDERFYSLPLLDKKEKLEELADEWINENRPKTISSIDSSSITNNNNNGDSQDKTSTQ